jgi:hypothetical protein
MGERGQLTLLQKSPKQWDKNLLHFLSFRFANVMFMAPVVVPERILERKD